MREQIAHNIKFLREQNNWTQKELAEKLLISRSVIAKWENNSVTPDIMSLLKLSEIFQVSLDHLVGNYSFRDDLLKEFKRIYSSSPNSFDEEAVEIVEYIMTNPEFKKEIFELKQLSIKKQHSIHKLIAELIQQYKNI
ncbi:MAG: helix-turn-helix domain-containing protein [Bacillota bacterium]|uniref:Helix-turn-helix domain-containing protein n=1 Tax=Virgibacillus salarius TaxID=447199 RepID=A0A941IBH9_9BACI|nr:MULTISPECIES: helix-turn-helix domain-containing protein [Bacillaceae]NAZ07971.1 helix-turn-helix domain-containing protein [Agaribacter marinus]MBR7795255.1 helix-turn-helix domain-containing protein [Virgibacillus salarius]MCC2252770.1 helix-turn-helix domain-containing protein [Virgibacillus sp. AGTR]MDY7045370.1 helix-turn-helix domain-containing protein [Virgibacillus sp. M23]WBX80360.1 helix-turn-helix domain-containing protein [Virgibacillus salarius]